MPHNVAQKQAAWLSQLCQPVGHGRRVNQQFRIFCTSPKANQTKDPTHSQIKCGTLGDFGPSTLSRSPSPAPFMYFPFPFPVQQKHLLAQLFGPLFECCYGICRIAFIIWLAQRPFEPQLQLQLQLQAATATAARNELCIDFLFAILTALTLFPSGGDGGRGGVAEATLRQRQTK